MLSFGTRWHNLTSEFQSNHDKLSHWKWKTVSPSLNLVQQKSGLKTEKES